VVLIAHTGGFFQDEASAIVDTRDLLLHNGNLMLHTEDLVPHDKVCAKDELPSREHERVRMQNTEDLVQHDQVSAVHTGSFFVQTVNVIVHKQDLAMDDSVSIMREADANRPSEKAKPRNLFFRMRHEE
jgi:hypothetical protein